MYVSYVRVSCDSLSVCVLCSLVGATRRVQTVYGKLSSLVLCVLTVGQFVCKVVDINRIYMYIYIYDLIDATLFHPVHHLLCFLFSLIPHSGAKYQI